MDHPLIEGQTTNCIFKSVQLLEELGFFKNGNALKQSSKCDLTICTSNALWTSDHLPQILLDRPFPFKCIDSFFTRHESRKREKWLGKQLLWNF